MYSFFNVDITDLLFIFYLEMIIFILNLKNLKNKDETFGIFLGYIFLSFTKIKKPGFIPSFETSSSGDNVAYIKK